MSEPADPFNCVRRESDPLRQAKLADEVAAALGGDAGSAEWQAVAMKAWRRDLGSTVR